MISVVIPVYNEEESIPKLYERLTKVLINKDYEIVFINDGSTDSSFSKMKELKAKDKNVRIINLAANCGSSSAFDAGFKNSRGDIIVTLDADLQNPPEEIPKLLNEIDNYDLVYGRRKKRNDNLVKILSSRIGNAWRNWVTREDVADTACALKAFKKSSLDKIKLYKGMHRFLITLFKIEGMKVKEVQVEHSNRKYGKSKFNVMNRLFKGFVDCLAVAWMKDRHIEYTFEEVK
jgi:dolichol-phosphate mannosyltransferase